jgi:adenine-specific DNA methylase
MKRAIEEGFPIVGINRLAVPERNAFKPIYQMHKWFARRASCVFRAILLGCLKPAGTDIMAEFYKDHTDDPDTAGKVILDPFMGGGTTIVEALRLGCKVIGIDLNPVAWFIVKTEVEPVEIEELKAAFGRLAERTVPWTRLPDGQGGKSVRETLLEQYKTTCPCCGSTDADIIYTFWVKSAVCTNPAPPCGKKTLVPLFSDYLVAQKSPSIRFWRDAKCPKCRKTFDWEVEPATLIGEADLLVSSSAYSAGEGRTTARWGYSPGEKVKCPWCSEEVAALPASGKLQRKKVPLSVLLCPFCEVVWQWRGELPEEVICPSCHREYDPHNGNVPDKGKFLCPTCGTKDAIIASIRQLPEQQLLPMNPYAIQGYCARCAGDLTDEDEEEETDLLGQRPKRKSEQAPPDHPCMLTKSNGKFFTRVRPADLARYKDACTTWEREKDRLPYPKSEVPWGEKTKSGLIAHHYRYWHQMFNPRQLLCLSMLLGAIIEERQVAVQELLLSTFHSLLERNNLFCRYYNGRDTVQGSFARHDYQPKLDPTEANVWGADWWRGTFPNLHTRTLEGKAYARHPYDWMVLENGNERHMSGETVHWPTHDLRALDARDLRFVDDGAVHFVVTDPPYAGNVNYAELADFFYVWLRIALRDRYPTFAPEFTPKNEEVVENPARGKTIHDFKSGLQHVFSECHRKLDPEGILVFTFHHAEGSAWEAVLEAVCAAGFSIEAAYPIHGEKESSLHLQEKGAISYDLIHVCRNRPVGATVEKRQWAGIRQEIRRRAREEIRAIEAGRYGAEPLSPSDVNIILIGKCLELYSRHYGAVMDQDTPLELRDALKEIRSLVDQLVTTDRPLSSELEDIDAESRVYFLALCERKEVKTDEVHKVTRGVLEPEDLIEAGLIIKGRAGRGRTYEVKQPTERLQQLEAKFRVEPAPQLDLIEGDRPKAKGRVYFIDYVHFLMALAEAGENLIPWLDRFRGETPRLRAACEYLANRNKGFAAPLKKIQHLLEPTPLFDRR